jgi:hypothetical protein
MTDLVQHDFRTGSYVTPSLIAIPQLLELVELCSEFGPESKSEVRGVLRDALISDEEIQEEYLTDQGWKTTLDLVCGQGTLRIDEESLVHRLAFRNGYLLRKAVCSDRTEFEEIVLNTGLDFFCKEEPEKAGSPDQGESLIDIVRSDLTEFIRFGECAITVPDGPRLQLKRRPEPYTSQEIKGLLDSLPLEGTNLMQSVTSASPDPFKVKPGWTRDPRFARWRKLPARGRSGLYKVMMTTRAFFDGDDPGIHPVRQEWAPNRYTPGNPPGT